MRNNIAYGNNKRVMSPALCLVSLINSAYCPTVTSYLRTAKGLGIATLSLYYYHVLDESIFPAYLGVNDDFFIAPDHDLAIKFRL